MPMHLRTVLLPTLALLLPMTALGAPAQAASHVRPSTGQAGAATATDYVESARWLTGGAPDGIAVDPSGRVLTSLGDKVEIYNQAGTRTGLFALHNGYSGHTDVAAGPNGDIFVSHMSGQAVERYNSAGTYLGEWPGQSFYPYGLATTASGQIWVADPGKDVVKRLNPSAADVGSSGTKPGQLDGPRDIAYGSGSVYVLEDGNHRISRFSATTGAFQGSWGQAGSSAGQFRDEKSVATLPDGRVLELEGPQASDGAIQIFSATGAYESRTTIPVSYASDIATDAQGNIYVAGLLDYPNGGYGVLRLSVGRPAGPGTSSGSASVGGAKVDATKKRKRVKVLMTCAGSVPCNGTLSVTKAGKVLAAGGYALGPGQRAKVKIALTKTGRKALRRKAKSKVVISWTAAGGVQTRPGKLTR